MERGGVDEPVRSLNKSNRCGGCSGKPPRKRGRDASPSPAPGGAQTSAAGVVPQWFMVRAIKAAEHVAGFPRAQLPLQTSAEPRVVLDVVVVVVVVAPFQSQRTWGHEP